VEPKVYSKQDHAQQGDYELLLKPALDEPGLAGPHVRAATSWRMLKESLTRLVSHQKMKPLEIASAGA
jgi:hypothetical protein